MVVGGRLCAKGVRNSPADAGVAKVCLTHIAAPEANYFHHSTVLGVNGGGLSSRKHGFEFRWGRQVTPIRPHLASQVLRGTKSGTERPTDRPFW